MAWSPASMSKSPTVAKFPIERLISLVCIGGNCVYVPQCLSFHHIDSWHLIYENHTKKAASFLWHEEQVPWARLGSNILLTIIMFALVLLNWRGRIKLHSENFGPLITNNFLAFTTIVIGHDHTQQGYTKPSPSDWREVLTTRYTVS